MMSRLVKSPLAPKIVMVAGAGRRERHFATIAAISFEIVVIAVLPMPVDDHRLRGAFALPFISALCRSHNVLDHDFVQSAGILEVETNSGGSSNHSFIVTTQ